MAAWLLSEPVLSALVLAVALQGLLDVGAADAITFYEDVDGDEYGDSASTLAACSATRQLTMLPSYPRAA